MACWLMISALPLRKPLTTTSSTSPFATPTVQPMPITTISNVGTPTIRKMPRWCANYWARWKMKPSGNSYSDFSVSNRCSTRKLFSFPAANFVSFSWRRRCLQLRVFSSWTILSSGWMLQPASCCLMFWKSWPNLLPCKSCWFFLCWTMCRLLSLMWFPLKMGWWERKWNVPPICGLFVNGMLFVLRQMPLLSVNCSSV